jgi:hypothetical protein
MHAPISRMNRRVNTRHISDHIPRLVIANMRRPAARIPVQKESRPPVVMHRLSLSFRWQGDFQHPHQSVLKNNPVALRCGFYGIKSLREGSRVLHESKYLPSTDKEKTGQRDTHRGSDKDGPKTIGSAHFRRRYSETSPISSGGRTRSYSSSHGAVKTSKGTYKKLLST